MLDHNFVDEMSQFLNGQSTEVQLPPPGPAPEPQKISAKRKAPKPVPITAPKPKRKKTTQSYSYESLRQTPENIPQDLLKPIEKIQLIFERGKKILRLLTTSPELTEEHFVRSRGKLVQSIGDAIGIVLQLSGADKRIRSDTFDSELQSFEVPEARMAQMEGKSGKYVRKQWKKQFYSHLASSVKRKKIGAIPPYFQFSQRSKELMSFKTGIEHDIHFDIQPPKRPPTTPRDKPPKMTGLTPTTPYPAPSISLKDLEAAEDKRQGELAKQNELSRKEHLSSVPAPLPVQHVPVKPVVRKPPKPPVAEYADYESVYPDRDPPKTSFPKEQHLKNIQGSTPKEDVRKVIVQVMAKLKTRKPSPEVTREVDWWSRKILIIDLQSGHNPEALSNNIKFQIGRIEKNLKDSAEQLKAYEEMYAQYTRRFKKQSRYKRKQRSTRCPKQRCRENLTRGR